MRSKPSVVTVLHGMQMRSSDEISVCLSVCQTPDLWQKRKKVVPAFLSHMKDHLP